MTSRRSFICLAGAAIAGGLARAAASADAALSGTARLLVGFAPGGLLDVVARMVAREARGFASSFIVENRPGAGGRLALSALKSAPADGSVMVFTPASMVVLYPHLYPKLSYDVFADLAPVAPVCDFPFLLTVGPLVPSDVRTLADFVQWCRTHPAQASYGTAAAGSMLHFTGVSLARAAGFEFVHVPYGGPGGIQDLAGGRIAATIYPLGTALPHVQSGRIRALATTGKTRLPALPDVPTVSEAGFPMIEGTEWFGVFAPAKTPPEVVARLNAAIGAAARTVEFQSGLAKLSVDSAFATPGEFAQRLKDEYERWAPIVRASGFKPED
jgi:tripartite-type tricarboxylate transporter receptor subunit TctC